MYESLTGATVSREKGQNTDRRTDRKTDRWTNKQAGRQTYICRQGDVPKQTTCRRRRPADADDLPTHTTCRRSRHAEAEDVPTQTTCRRRRLADVVKGSTNRRTVPVEPSSRRADSRIVYSEKKRSISFYLSLSSTFLSISLPGDQPILSDYIMMLWCYGGT